MAPRPSFSWWPAALFFLSAVFTFGMSRQFAFSNETAMRAIELTGHGNDVVNNYFLNQNAQLSNYYRYLLASIAFGLAAYALIYWLYPVLLKRDLNTRLGVAHFALTLTGLGGVLGRVSVLALSGISRPRLEDEWYGPYGLGRFATVCLGLVAIGQLVFLYNFIRSPLVRREA